MHPDLDRLDPRPPAGGEMPRLDEQRRPKELYGTDIHKKCPLKKRMKQKLSASKTNALKNSDVKAQRQRQIVHLVSGITEPIGALVPERYVLAALNGISRQVFSIL